MVKILKHDNPDHKIKPKTRQVQVMGKSTGQINNIGYKWYIGSHFPQGVIFCPERHFLLFKDQRPTGGELASKDKRKYYSAWKIPPSFH